MWWTKHSIQIYYNYKHPTAFYYAFYLFQRTPNFHILQHSNRLTSPPRATCKWPLIVHLCFRTKIVPLYHRLPRIMWLYHICFPFAAAEKHRRTTLRPPLLEIVTHIVNTSNELPTKFVESNAKRHRIVQDCMMESNFSLGQWMRFRELYGFVYCFADRNESLE